MARTLCKCGHTIFDHIPLTGECIHDLVKDEDIDDNFVYYCSCNQYEPVIVEESEEKPAWHSK